MGEGAGEKLTKDLKGLTGSILVQWSDLQIDRNEEPIKFSVLFNLIINYELFGTAPFFFKKKGSEQLHKKSLEFIENASWAHGFVIFIDQNYVMLFN